MEVESAEEVLSVSDRWNLHSVYAITKLQDRFAPYDSWINHISVLGNNPEAFTFFFPIVAGLSSELGVRMLWAAILVEWSNLILKWIFKGDRPYWWVGETSLYNETTRPNLRQYPNTCESGPGTPSGHVMMNVAVFYVISQGLIEMTVRNSKKLSQWQKFLALVSIYQSYFTWVSFVIFSRLYIQAHFIHQCVLAIFIGLAVGHFAWSSKFLVCFNKKWAISIPVLLISSASSIYFLLLSQGHDPMWSIPLALKHCAKTEYVKIDTQPYYIMTRFSGAALGLGLGFVSEQRKVALKMKPNYIRTILCVKGGMIIGKIATIIQASLPVEDLTLFLTLSFGLSAIVPFIVIALLNKFLLSILGK